MVVLQTLNLWRTVECPQRYLAARAESSSAEQAKHKAQLMECLSDHDHITEHQDIISRYK